MEALAAKQRKVLWTVLAINVTMFFVEVGGGVLSGSLALTGDSFDMLGDAIAYGTSIYVVSRGALAKVRAARLKAVIIFVSAAGLLGTACYRFIARGVPHAEAMGGIAVAALVANAVCLLLLTRFKDDDVNMASVWACSRNDIASNVSVIGAAILVRITASPWPDLIVGIALTVLFVTSGARILRATRPSMAFAQP